MSTGYIAAARAASTALGIRTYRKKRGPEPKGYAGADDHEARARCRAELDERRHRPRPEARPLPDASPAIKALRKALRTASGSERERVQATLDRALACYRPASLPAQPDSRKPATRPFKCRPGTIKAYTAELLQEVSHTDAAGHRIGLSYAEIQARTIARFPVVQSGRHRGKPTRCAKSELEATAAQLHLAGIVLPFRPRGRKAH